MYEPRAGLVTRLRANVADTCANSSIKLINKIMIKIFNTYSTISKCSLMFISHVGNISKYDRKSNGKKTRKYHQAKINTV